MHATVVVHPSAPDVKVRGIVALGAKVVCADPLDYDSGVERVLLKTGASFIHSHDDRTVIAGEGTIGLGVAAQMPEVETVFVPVCGGGVLAALLSR